MQRVFLAALLVSAWSRCALADEISVATMPPVVVKTVPQSGDTRVDPSLSEIRVTFSKDMQDGSWSWTQISDETFPEITGKLRYLADKRTCVAPVKLEPGKTYVTWLNSAKFGNFKDADRRPAVPYLLVFETKKAAGARSRAKTQTKTNTKTSAREWTSSTGAFTVEAELVDFEDGKVRLRKADGKVLTLPIDRLSKADQQYLEQLQAKQEDPEQDDPPATVSPTQLTGRPQELANDDGTPAGKKSFPHGHAVGFDAPEGAWYLSSVRLHGSRYGPPTPPQEDFHVWLCDKDFNQIADFTFPYALFQRGSPEWVSLKTKPAKVPEQFVICVGFNATATKGVYVSHDAQGQSLVGLAGRKAGNFTGGDWLIRVELDQVKTGARK